MAVFKEGCGMRLQLSVCIKKKGSRRGFGTMKGKKLEFKLIHKAGVQNTKSSVLSTEWSSTTPNSYVKTLIPNVMSLEVEPLEDNLIIRVETS